MFTLAVVTVAVLLCVVLPLVIVLHFITRWKQSREFSKEDEQMLEDLWQMSQRLEERLETLERILDDDLPPRSKRRESTHLEH